MRPELAPDDWEQCTLFEKRYFPLANMAAKGHGHIRVAEIQPYLLPGQWEGFYSFAFVRNPFDRFLSFCTFYQTSPDAMRNDPLGTMKFMIANPAVRAHVLMQPQVTFLRDATGRIATRFIGRYETLQRDFDSICDCLKIARRDLSLVNASDRAHPTIKYDDELREALIDFYAEDFVAFGYDRGAAEIAACRPQ